MSLTAGSRLGPYEILAPLGAGGMGEVYRARDTRLDRDVALKVLPDVFASDPERLARFGREAKTLAALNHPHIAQVYGLEKSEGIHALAMELVEGEDLSERIARGAVPIDEAVPIARQIAEALEAAHDHGIIHRDLKPANIKVRTDGTVKVLDFGLARPAAAGASFDAALTSPAMTAAGVILGTAAYMAPEQARGKPVDKRADIWAFGCVLFEMLGGRRPFDGESITDTLARVIEREPDWRSLPATTPSHVARVIRRCLEKDPARRLRDIGDARIELEWPAATDAVAIAPSRRSTRHRMGVWLPWIVAGLAVAALTWVMSAPGDEALSTREVVHLDLAYPHDVEAINSLSRPFAISPDGQTLAFVGVKDGTRAVFVRRVDSADVTTLARSPAAISVEFSPDGTRLAVLPGSGVVEQVSLADGASKIVVSGADYSTGLAWGERGLVFGRGGALWVVNAEGGEPRQLTTLDAARKEVMHAMPTVLPGGLVALFTSFGGESATERIEAVALEDGRRTVVVERASAPVWSPTGHLLFVRDRGVFAVRFDPKSQTVSGSAVSVFPPGVLELNAVGDASFDVSREGTLVAVPAGFGLRRIVRVSRDGSTLALNQPPGLYAWPRLAPDGRRLIVLEDESTLNLIDMARGTRTPLIAPAFATSFATWNADGTHVVVRRFSKPFWMAADGRGLSGDMPGTRAQDYPASAGPDPDSIAMVRVGPETAGDVYLMSLTGKFEPRPLVATRAFEGDPQFSPDAKWLLYQSDESGQFEMYVKPYPALDRRWQVSEGGGIQGRWNHSGTEVFYRNGRRMIAVSVDLKGPEPSFGKPVELFSGVFDYGQGVTIPNYDVTPDGHFIMLRPEPNSSRLRVVLNWTKELTRILARSPTE